MDEKEEAKKKLGLGDDIPMLDITDDNFKQDLDFALWTTNSSSDYRNDRERPYNGQEHTDDGKRGEQLVVGLTMRDIKDCLIKAILQSAPCEEYLKGDVFTKCWDFSTDPAKPTQYLLDRLDEPDFITCKADPEINNWRPQDVYKVDFSNIDPLAIGQNLTCNIEKMMGIFPNIPKIEDKDDD